MRKLGIETLFSIKGTSERETKIKKDYYAVSTGKI